MNGPTWRARCEAGHDPVVLGDQVIHAEADVGQPLAEACSRGLERSLAVGIGRPIVGYEVVGHELVDGARVQPDEHLVNETAHDFLVRIGTHCPIIQR